MMKLLKTKYNGGFTLIELMVVVAIISVMVGLAGPNLMNMVKTTTLRNATRQLRNDLQQAKLIAIKDNKTVNITINANNYIIDGATVTLPNGLTLTHNLVGLGCTSRGSFVFSKSSTDDPYIKVSSTTDSRTINIYTSGHIVIL